MIIDLNTSLGREAFAAQLIGEIDAYCVNTYGEGPRSHLGASVIGEACSRQLWYSFRWAFIEPLNGRMLRLFNRGHLEEQRWISWLRGIGWTINEFDPQSRLFYHGESDAYIVSNEHGSDTETCEEVTGDLDHERRAMSVGVKRKQFRLSDFNGHFGGSLDGVGTHPAFGEERFLFEFKTSGTKQYDNLINEGVQKNKPLHWGQMCVYGKRNNIRYAVYCPINKNDDDISALQVLELDLSLAEMLERKAEFIINSAQPPDKLSENPAYYECRFCKARFVCHESAPVLKNCRSCRHAKPVENAQWHCGKFNGIIPSEYVAVGCEHHYGVGT